MSPALGTRIGQALLVLRLGLGGMMLYRSIFNFFEPLVEESTLQSFYGITVTPVMSLSLSIAEILVIIAFLFGYRQAVTYFIVFTINVIGVGTSFAEMVRPAEWVTHLFDAGLPSLAGFWVIFALRELDMFSIDNWLAYRRKYAPKSKVRREET